jgi:lipopolysaccharide exporter
VQSSMILLSPQNQDERIIMENLSSIIKNSWPSRSSFLSDVLKLAGGTAIAQVIGIMVAPLITRLYGPEAFGQAALFASIVGVAACVVCMRYEVTIILPKEDEDAANLLALCLLLAILFSIIIVPVIWLVGEELLHLLKAPGLLPYLWLVSPSIFLSGIFTALNYWNLRTKRFGGLSIARVIASFASVGTLLGAGFAGYAGGGSMIGASLIGSATSTMILGGQIWHNDRKLLYKSIKTQRIAAGIVRYREFPLYQTWASLLNSFSGQLPIFILSAFFSTTVVGYYALCMMFLQMPMSLMGGSISQVFFQRLSIAKYDGSLTKIVEDTFESLVTISICPFLALSLIGEDAFVVVFGPQWAMAGVYSQILALSIFFIFIASPLTSLFDILEKQKAYLIYNIIITFFRASALVIGGYLGDPLVAIFLYSSVSVAASLLSIIWLLNEAGIKFIVLSRKIFVIILYSVPAFVLIFFTKYAFHASSQMVIVISILVTILYYFKVILHIRD